MSRLSDEKLREKINELLKELDDRGTQWTKMVWTDDEGWRLEYV